MLQIPAQQNKGGKIDRLREREKSVDGDWTCSAGLPGPVTEPGVSLFTALTEEKRSAAPAREVAPIGPSVRIDLIFLWIFNLMSVTSQARHYLILLHAPSTIPLVNSATPFKNKLDK